MLTKNSRADGFSHQLLPPSATSVRQTCYNLLAHLKDPAATGISVRVTAYRKMPCVMKRRRSAPYPILEFDPTREAFIDPSKVIKPRDVPEHCVLCFFGDVIDKVVTEHNARVIVENRWEDGPHPLYEIEHTGKRLAFMHPGIGGPLASSLLEEVIGFGCRKFIACGGCGALDPDIAIGSLIVVTAAVRDEGVSYHYLPPGREVRANQQGISALETALRNKGVPYQLGKTWTTCAPYRETRARIATRRSEGCIAVEMEAAAMLAVAQHRQVILGQVVYGGDDLSGEVWDNREWQKHEEVRERLFWLAAEACLGL